MNENFIKICVVGEKNVGKTNIINRYSQNIFDANTKPTLGLDFFHKKINKKDKTYNIRIWDTCGEERYKTLATNNYKGSKGVVLVYDITDINSFKIIDEWLLNIRENSEEKSIIILVGNKKDLIEERVVQEDDAISYCKKNKIIFVETSAKEENNTNNIETLFSTLINQILENYTEEDLGKNFTEITNNKKMAIERNKNKCC